MTGRDVNSNPTQYRTWIANVPDLTGALYTGPKSGPNPLVDIVVYSVVDDSVIADFNLPLPQVWYDPDHLPAQFDYPAKRVLPEVISDSQLAVIDGYVYLFGGKVSDKIWRAPLNNPADWVDTGATLPTKLYGSQLAILNGTIYLFGGNSGNFEFDEGLGAVDTIYSARASDPLTWTNHGSKLPRKLFNSTMAIFGGEIYLYGGQEINSASDVIFRAPANNPLSWVDTGSRLPDRLYGSTTTVVNGFVYLFGGQLFPDRPTSNIYQAAVTNPTFVYHLGALPYEMSFCQLINVGGFSDGYAYLFGQGQGAPAIGTRILRASLSSLTQWADVVDSIPGVISHSQAAIIYDRIWLFGGSGESAIFTCWQQLKYGYYDPKVLSYANSSRTVFNSSDNIDGPFDALGFPYWKTDYPTFQSPPPPKLWIAGFGAGTPYLFDVNPLTLQVNNAYPYPSPIFGVFELSSLHDSTSLWANLIESGGGVFIGQTDPSDGYFDGYTAVDPAFTVSSFYSIGDGYRYLYLGSNGSTNGGYKFDTQTLTTIGSWDISSQAFNSYGVAYDPVTGDVFQGGGDAFLYRINSQTLAITRTSIADGYGSGNSYFPLAALGSIWLSCDNSNQHPNHPHASDNFVKRIDPTTGHVIATIRSSSMDSRNFAIYDIKYNATHNYIIASHPNDGFIDIIDPNTNLVIHTYHVTPSYGNALTLATYSDYLWGVDEIIGYCVLINLRTRTVVGYNTISAGTALTGIIYTL